MPLIPATMSKVSVSIMKKMGISSWKNQPKHYGLSLTLGGAEVKPVELAQAYNILANFGVKKDLKFLLEPSLM